MAFGDGGSSALERNGSIAPSFRLLICQVHHHVQYKIHHFTVQDPSYLVHNAPAGRAPRAVYVAAPVSGKNHHFQGKNHHFQGKNHQFLLKNHRFCIQTHLVLDQRLVLLSSEKVVADSVLHAPRAPPPLPRRCLADPGGQQAGQVVNCVIPTPPKISKNVKNQQDIGKLMVLWHKN